MRLLVFNAGSSSLKFALFNDEFHALTRGVVREPANYGDAVRSIQKTLLERKLIQKTDDINAIGQRVVHGGTKFTAPTRITTDVIAEIDALSEIAPLHNPPALECIRAVTQVFPKASQFAVFDTAYFQTLAPEQFVYPVPYDWYSEWGLRRFGFHGISHGDCAFRAAERLGRIDLRVVSCHLGQGASVTASHAQKAVATTMGFTPLEGVMMGSRSGSVDPGLLLYTQRKHNLSAEKLEGILNHASGIKGVSGLSGDFRELEKEAAAGNERAQLALSMFVNRVREAIGAMAATLGGIDVLIFTGGIGENSANVRQRILQGLEFLGVGITKGNVLVLPADEEAVIAREAGKLLGRFSSEAV